MLITGYKNVRSFILGIKTPKIYEKYEITNMKLLEIKKFFEILS
jgi:hypothetical protein